MDITIFAELVAYLKNQQYQFRAEFSAPGVLSTTYHILSVGKNEKGEMLIHLEPANDVQVQENNPLSFLAWAGTQLKNAAGRMAVGGETPYLVFSSERHTITGEKFFSGVSAALQYQGYRQGSFLFSCTGNGVTAQLRFYLVQS